VSGYELFAEDLRIKDVGRTVRSAWYRDKNKTTKPSVWHNRDGSVERTRVYTIDSIYVHKNGNILINNSIYLRPKTIIEFVENEND